MIRYLSPSNRVTVVVIGREPLDKEDRAWLKAIQPALVTRQNEIWSAACAARRRNRPVAPAVDVQSQEGAEPVLT